MGKKKKRKDFLALITSVSRSEEEMEEIVGEDGGGTNSLFGSSISVRFFSEEAIDSNWVNKAAALSLWIVMYKVIIVFCDKLW